MKKYILFLSLFLFFPFGSFASSYSRTPTGNNITSPVTISYSVDFLADFGWLAANYYAFTLEETNSFDVGYHQTSACFPISENSKTLIFTIPTGTTINFEKFIGFNTDNNCLYNNDDWASTLSADSFTIISGNVSYLTLPNSAPTDLFASVANLFSDFWILIALAIGIPLAFTIIHFIIGLISGKDWHPPEKQ